MRKLISCVYALALLITLTACSKEIVVEGEVRENVITETMISLESTTECITESMMAEEVEFDYDDVMDGMKYLCSWNKEGICLNLKGAETINDYYVLMPENGVVTFEVESGGNEYTELTVQILLDYEQVPIKIDGEIYDKYTFSTNGNISLTKSFEFVQEVDTNVNHQLTLILTRDSEKHAGDVPKNSGRMTGQVGAINAVLVFGYDNELCDFNKQYEQTSLCEDVFDGIWFSQEEGELRRAVPKNVYAKCGEEVTLFYDVGGYEKYNEVLFFCCIDCEQWEINGKKYLMCNTPNGNIAHGICTFKAPDKIGRYDVMGYMVTNPFRNVKESRDKLQSLDFTMYRFTLNVSN